MSIPIWARIGAKAVCIKKGTWVPIEGSGFGYVDRHPGYGEVVTISGVFVQRSGLVALTLEGYEPNHYFVERFRPLITRTQDEDIALFRHHLDNAGVDA